MRILHLNEHLAPRGGVETYLLSAIPRLEAAGHPQGVAYAHGEAGLVTHAYELPELGSAARGDERTAAERMRRTIRDFGADVVHLHNIYNVGAIDACLDEVPVVLTAHDYRYLCPASNFYYRRTQEICERTCSPACFAVTLSKRCLTPRPGYSLRYYRRVRWMSRNFSRFSGLIAPSQAAADRFAQAGFPEERISVLPYFCRVPPLSVPRPVPKQHRILYLGRLSENKGWKYFVEALGLLPSTVQGQIVGNITPQNEVILTELAEQHGCRGRLQWRSWADEAEIREMLHQTSLLVFPSLWAETLGIVGLEALAHGVPVVASDVGGVREWLHENETGLLVPPKSAGQLARACLRILEDRGCMQSMGEAGLRLIRERFRPQGHLEKLIGTYSAMSCGRSGAPLSHVPQSALASADEVLGKA